MTFLLLYLCCITCDISFVFLVAKRVVSRHHKLQDRELQVYAYYPCLGLQPPSIDVKTPMAWLPSHILVDCACPVIDFLLSSPSCKSEVENKMLSCMCKIEWPSVGNEGRIRLKSDINLSQVIVMNNAERWEETVKIFWNDSMKSFSHATIQLMEATWKSFVEKIAEITSNEGLKVKLISTVFEVQIAGKTSAVKDTLSRLQEIKNYVDEDVKRQKDTITEKVNLKQYELHLLRMKNFDQEMIAKYPGISVVIPEKGCVVLTGLAGDVLKVSLEMNDELRLIQSKNWSTSPDVIKLLERPAMLKHLQDRFHREGVMLHLDFVDNKDLSLFGFRKDHLDRGLKIIEQLTYLRKLKIEDHWKALIASGRLQTWIDSVVKENNDLIVFEINAKHNSLLLISGKSKSDDLIENLLTFIQDNTEIQKFCGPYQISIVNFVKRFMVKDILSVEDDLKSCSVKISFEKKGPDTQPCIRGTRHGVSSAEKRLATLINGLVVDYFKYEDSQAKPAAKYLAGKGRLYLDALETKHQVVIQPEIIERMGKMKAESEDKILVNNKEVMCFNIESGIRILLIEGNIVQQKVDAIINPTNQKLEMTGGVAAAILKAGKLYAL